MTRPIVQYSLTAFSAATFWDLLRAAASQLGAMGTASTNKHFHAIVMVIRKSQGPPSLKNVQGHQVYNRQTRVQRKTKGTNSLRHYIRKTSAKKTSNLRPGRVFGSLMSSGQRYEFYLDQAYFLPPAVANPQGITRQPEVFLSRNLLSIRV